MGTTMRLNFTLQLTIQDIIARFPLLLDVVVSPDLSRGRSRPKPHSGSNRRGGGVGGNGGRSPPAATLRCGQVAGSGERVVDGAKPERGEVTVIKQPRCQTFHCHSLSARPGFMSPGASFDHTPRHGCRAWFFLEGTQRETSNP